MGQDRRKTRGDAPWQGERARATAATTKGKAFAEIVAVAGESCTPVAFGRAMLGNLQSERPALPDSETCA